MFIGVDLFFVLSGFLITGVLIQGRDDPHRARNFYVRRVLRIFPAYYFVLLFVILIYPHFNPQLKQIGLGNYSALYFLHLQNWIFLVPAHGTHWPGVDHFWSLAIEEQFYLVWPLIVWITPLQRLAQVCGLVFCASVALKLALFLHGSNWMLLYIATPSHIEGLAAGSGVAALWHVHKLRQVPRALQIFGAVALLGLAITVTSRSGYVLESSGQVLAHTVLSSIAFAWMVYATVAAPHKAWLPRALSLRPLRFLGQYSYGIYLIHWVIRWQLKPAVQEWLTPYWSDDAQALISGCVLVACSIVLAVLMYHGLEKPMLNLKRILAPKSGNSAN